LKKREKGGITIEVILLTPVVVAFMMFAVYLGRVSKLGLNLRQAVHQAARAATYPLEAEDAREAARLVLIDSLGPAQFARCSSPIIDTSMVGLQGDANDTGVVTVALTCKVNESSLGPFAFGKTVTARAGEPIDDYRSRKYQP
jgi:Flp pilus assembly protein TadG